MYNSSYLGQQPPGQQQYGGQYQMPQQTGYQPPQTQPQFQQQPQFLQTQPTGYGGVGGFGLSSTQTGQYGVPPVPQIPSQYTQQPPQPGLQPTTLAMQATPQ